MLNEHIIDFNENIIALRDFVDLIDPFLTKKMEEHDKYIRPFVVSALVDEVLEKGEDINDEHKQLMIDYKEEVSKNIIEKFEEIPDIKFGRKTHGSKSEIFASIPISDNKFSQHFENLNKNQNHIELLYTNALISTLSSVEWFFSRLLHYFYDRHPESEGFKKKQ